EFSQLRHRQAARPKENSGVSIKSSSFVETRQGSADRGGAARPAPQRRKAGVDDRRLHCRDAAHRHASSHTRSRRPRWRGPWWRGTWRRWRWAWWWRTLRRLWRTWRRVRRAPRRNKLRGTRRRDAFQGGAYWQGAQRRRTYRSSFNQRQPFRRAFVAYRQD